MKLKKRVVVISTFAAIFILFVASYENCGSAGGTGSSFNIGTSSSTVGGLATPINMSFSAAGPILGLYCVNVINPSDAAFGANNYLCADQDIQLQWSYSGIVAGKFCTLVAPPGINGWSNITTYICSGTNVNMFFSAAGAVAGYRCISMANSEGWANDYLCYP